MMILAAISAVLAAGFALLYLLQRAQARRLTRQLQKLERGQLVTMSFPSPTNQALVREINRFLLEDQRAEQLRRREELHLQEMISNISHDMRTPLTAILGYIHLINSADVTPEERQRYLLIVENRARSLQRLLVDFYDLSRVSDGSLPLQAEAMDVNGFCLELLAELYDDLERSGVEVHAALLPSAPPVSADRAALRRIYENLFQNAAKHGTGKLWVASRVEADRLLLTVANSCAPIGPEQLEKMFDRSYTASRSRSEGNTGLGLAICKSLIEAMGHQITLDHKDGIFTVRIAFHLYGGPNNE